MIQSIFTFDKLLQRLQLGKEVTPFVIWRENDLFGTHDNPVKIDIPCLFLCLDGEMQLDINLQSYRFNREHLLCFIAPCACRIVSRSRVCTVAEFMLPNTCACRIVSRSPGFRCVGLLLSKSFWRQLVLAERTLGKIAIRDAFIAVNDDEHGRLTRFYELLCLCADAPGLRDSADTLYPLILGMFCQVRNICRRLEDTATPASHSEKIFYDFLDLLHTHYRKQRRVSFYAGELSLTPRHLTTVIRLVSGRSAARWIEEYIVLEAQILLRNSPMAIKEIAYELGFNEQSLFSKYFSRVSGSSPESYRRSSTA